jgi:hypothetical protein
MAGQYAELAAAMRARGEDGQRVAHFLMRCLFCMFAEDEGILPDMLFSVVLEKHQNDPARAAAGAAFAGVGKRSGGD